MCSCIWLTNTKRKCCTHSKSCFIIFFCITYFQIVCESLIPRSFQLYHFINYILHICIYMNGDNKHSSSSDFQFDAVFICNIHIFKWIGYYSIIQFQYNIYKFNPTLSRILIAMSECISIAHNENRNWIIRFRGNEKKEYYILVFQHCHYIYYNIYVCLKLSYIMYVSIYMLCWILVDSDRLAERSNSLRVADVKRKKQALYFIT